LFELLNHGAMIRLYLRFCHNVATYLATHTHTLPHTPWRNCRCKLVSIQDL